jgi:hypothetical protein
MKTGEIFIVTLDTRTGRKQLATGYKIKRVRWHLVLDAFMMDYSDNNVLTEGARLTSLLKKAKNKDTVQANQKAIDSGMYETSESSEASDDLLKGAGLTDSSD